MSMICPKCKASYSSICLKCGYDPKTKAAKFSPKELGLTELPHVPMEISHVWLGKFFNEEEFENYFDESISDDVMPMNGFASDQGEIFYDHDWVERSYSNTIDIENLIEGHSYSVDYRAEVLKYAKNNGICDANSFILADVEEFKSPRSVESESYTLWYMGKYKCHV